MLYKVTKLVFLVMGYLASNWVQAQAGKIYKSEPKIPQVRLYVLTNEQALFALKNTNKLDTQILYTTLVKTWDYDSFLHLRNNIYNLYNQAVDENVAANLGLKKHGYYLLVSDVTEEGKTYVNLLDYPYYKCKVQKIDNETVVWVTDYRGQIMHNVNVSLNGIQALPMPGLGGYKLVNKELQGDIWIHGNGEFGYNRLINYSNVQVSKRSNPPADKYKYAKNYNGYITTNKQVFKRGDTIWWKAFITKPNGKGLRKPIKMWLQAYSPAGYSSSIMGKPINEHQKAQRIKRGAFEGFFVANDTFPLNTEYTLRAYKNKTYKLLKQHTIQVLEYEKENWQLGLTTTKSSYEPSETPSVRVQTLDKNGLPLLGAFLNVKVSLRNLLYAENDSIQINRRWFDTMYYTRLLADESGITELPLPKELFIPAEAQYNVTVNVSNNDFNQSTMTCDFYTTTNRNRAESKIEKDSLYVNFYYNQKEKSNRFSISFINQYGFRQDTVMISPIQVKIPSYIKSVFVNSMDSAFNYNTSIIVPLSIPLIWGKRGYDSIAVHMRSTSGEKIYYQLYRNNVLVKEGSDTAMHYEMYDKSKYSYHLRYIQFGHHGITAEVQQTSFHFAEKNLLISTNLNTTAFPNQWNEVLITVLKGNRKPAKNVNLTAYAVNKQLPVLQAPQVPYLGLIKPQKTMEITTLYTQFCGLSNIAIPLRPWMINDFNLRKQNFYNIQYPSAGVQVYTDTINDTTTQVQFIVHKGANFKPISALFNKNKLLYSDAYNRTSEVIEYANKTMDLEIYTNSNKLVIGKINIKPNCKNFVCIQIDSLQQNQVSEIDYFGSVQDSLNTILLNHSLFYTINGNYYDTFIIKQNGYLKQAYSSNKLRSSKTLWGNNKQYDAYGNEISKSQQMNFSVFGPVDPDDVIELNYKRSFGLEFRFKPNDAYVFTNSTQNAFPIGEKVFFLPMPHNSVNLLTTLKYQFLNPYWKDTLAQNNKPYYTPEPAYKPQIQLSKYNYSNYTKTYQYSSKVPTNQFLKLYTHGHFLKKLWVFELKDSSLSCLTNQVGAYMNWPGIDLQQYNVYLATYDSLPHTYMVYAQLENDSHWIVKKFTLLPNHDLLIVLNNKRKLVESEFFKIDRMAKILGQVPFEKFEDTPTIAGSISINAVNSKITKLEGLIIGPGIEYPVNNAFIILEQNGFYKYGAWSNSQGRFLIDNITPGTYMMKIKAKEYHYWINYNVQIAGGKNSLALIKLKLHSQYIYNTMEVVDEPYYRNSYTDNMSPTEYNYGSATSPKNMSNDANYSLGDVGGMDVIASSKRFKKAQGRTRTVAEQGSRNDDEGTYIESEVDEENQDNDGVEDMKDKSKESQYKNKERNDDYLILVDEMAKNQDANSLRTNFKDYAYWQPNLFTDKKGQARFAFRYPSDITSWQHYFPAMDNCRNSGILVRDVKSFKPIATQIAVPSYLLEGDELKTRININNYTSKSFNAPFNYIINGRETIQNIEVKKYWNTYISLPIAVLNKLSSIQAGIKLENGYIDAEKREIKVLPATVLTGISAVQQYTNKTNFTITVDTTDIEHSVTFYNNKLQAIISMLQNQDRLFYYSDIQTQANYLHTLLIKEKVAKELGIKVDNTDEIKRLVRTISQSQRNDGLIPRFKNSSFNDPFLMARIAEVMYLAVEQGYTNNTYYNCLKWLREHVKTSSIEEKTAMLYTLIKCNKAQGLEEEIKSLNTSNLSTTSRLRRAYIWQATASNQNDSTWVLSQLQISMFNDLQIESPSYYRPWCIPYFELDQSTYLAWEYLNKANIKSQIRQSLVTNLNRRMGTSAYSGALALQAYYTENKTNENNFPKMSINGKELKNADFPATYAPQQNMQVQLQSGEITLVSNRMFRTYKPSSDSNEFRIYSTLPASCALGAQINYTIDFMYSRNQDYAVIEIPIPAGFKLANKPIFTLPSEIHREYLEHKVIIYFAAADYGWRQVQLQLNAVYAGTFHTPPARIGLLDFGDKAAFSKPHTVSISQ